MSGGIACTCAERRVELNLRKWRVVQRRSNSSAFNGYQRQSSDYSRVCCLTCGVHWRTRAAYVSGLPALGSTETTLPSSAELRRRKT